jgi:two-component system, OmpR family, response regulator
MKFLFVEDDDAIGSSIVRSIQREGHQITWFKDGLQADAQLMTQRYDLVILDLGLPSLDGLQILQRLRARHDKTPVILLTARDELADRIQGLNTGADDYITKPFEFDELAARIRSVMRRAQPISAKVLFGKLLIDFDGREISLNGKPLDLSPREWGLFCAMQRKMGQVVSKGKLIELLAETDATALEISDSTIEVFIYRLRKKLEGAGVEIHTVRGFGYILKQID